MVDPTVEYGEQLGEIALHDHLIVVVLRRRVINHLSVVLEKALC